MGAPVSMAAKQKQKMRSEGYDEASVMHACKKRGRCGYDGSPVISLLQKKKDKCGYDMVQWHRQRRPKGRRMKAYGACFMSSTWVCCKKKLCGITDMMGHRLACCKNKSRADIPGMIYDTAGKMGPIAQTGRRRTEGCCFMLSRRYVVHTVEAADGVASP